MCSAGHVHTPTAEGYAWALDLPEGDRAKQQADLAEELASRWKERGGMWRADRSDPDVARWAALTDLITGEARMGISTENITSVGFDDPGLEPDDGSTDGT